MPSPNTGFASGGVTCKLGASCFYSSSVLVDSFVLRNPPERKARNRYNSYKATSNGRFFCSDKFFWKTCYLLCVFVFC